MVSINAQTIKEKYDIVEYIGQYVNLKKRGKNFVGLCPFHQEKTPSFNVNRNKQFFYCFGCGIGGDIFDFVMLQENISFYEALTKLASNIGITLNQNITYIKPKDNKITQKIYEYAKYTKSLQKNNAIDENILKNYTKYNDHQYFAKRGFDVETVIHFRLGFCFDQYDTLYNRLIIPWFDINGNLIGFHGRDVTDKSNIKYRFQPGVDYRSHLFNLNNARYTGFEQGIIIVEDEMSVFRLYQFGFTNVVALGGKASWNKYRFNLLNKTTLMVHLCLDNDYDKDINHGQKAQLKLAEELSQLFEVYLIQLPHGIKDVAEFKYREQWLNVWQKKKRF